MGGEPGKLSGMGLILFADEQREVRYEIMGKAGKMTGDFAGMDGPLEFTLILQLEDPAPTAWTTRCRLTGNDGTTATFAVIGEPLSGW